MDSVKPFLSVEDQVKLLKDRELNINDGQYEQAKEFFLNNNYYRISGYSLTLRQNDAFFKSASLETLMQIYEADRRMRHVMLSITEIVETRIKSMLAYFHCEKYGPLGYLDINNFSCSNNGNIKLSTIANYLHITRKADSQKNIMSDSELFLKHHRENKNNVLPFWVYVEILTISDVSKLYTMVDEDIRRTIAYELGFRSSNRHLIVENLLHCITILRNICAHGGRLYNRLFTRKPWLSKKEKGLLRVEKGNIIFDKLFSYILVLKSITLPKDFQLVIDHINQIQEQYPLVDFRHYGFPDNWKDVL
ncbi:Abi family protein [Phosphitispora sp. TUW77]|uniref:Abi family protein n=1 Tax=Phosphitispora sp. TUW77 TaxID=3152361 RepID=UPI003AB60E34